MMHEVKRRWMAHMFIEDGSDVFLTIHATEPCGLTCAELATVYGCNQCHEDYEQVKHSTDAC